MRKKTFFGGLVIALAALYPVASNFHGTKLHERVDKEVDKINHYLSQELGTGISVEAKLTHSSVFSSQYILGIKLADGKEIDLLKQDIEHGPFPLSALKRGHFVPVSYASKATLIHNDYTRNWFDIAASEEPLVAEYSFGYDKKIKGEIILAPTLYSDEKFNASTGDLSLHFSTDVDTDESSVDLNFGGVTVESSIVEKNLQPYRFRTGPWESHYAFTKQGDLRTHTSSNSLSEFSFEEGEVNISYPMMTVDETVTDDGKVINASDKTIYQGFLVNDVDFGKMATTMSIKNLDSKAAAQVRDLMGKLFADIIKQVAQDPKGFSEAHVTQVFDRYKIPLGMAIVSLLNQNPELGYDQLSLENKGGEAKATLQFSLLPFAVTPSAKPLDMLLNSLSKVNVNLQVERGAASQFLFDLLTLIAQTNKVALPTENDKKILDGIVADVEQSLVQSQLVKTNGDGKIELSVVADAGSGKSIYSLNTLKFNGEDVRTLALILQLDSQAKKATELLHQKQVAERVNDLVQRFNVSQTGTLIPGTDEAVIEEPRQSVEELDSEELLAPLPEDISLEEVEQRIADTEKDIESIKQLTIDEEEKKATVEWLNVVLKQLKERQKELKK